jgi:plastocyanin
MVQPTTLAARIAVILSLAAAGLVAAAAATAKPTTAVTLRGTVGPGYTISLSKNGRKVKSLRAGTYRFVVDDRSGIHNFVLEKERGGHVERELTDVGEVGTRTATIMLTHGTWKYYCESHEAMMFGSFTVR